MTSQITAEPKNLLLLWDVHFAAHQAFNKPLVGCLSADEHLSILYCSDYINRKLSYLSATRFDWLHMQTRHSKRKAVLRNVKGLVKVIIGRRQKIEVGYLADPNVEAMPVEALLERHFRQALRRRIFRLSSQEIFALKHNDYPIGQHFCVDMSLDCKSTSEELATHTPQLHNLRLAAYYSCLLVEALHRFFQAQPGNHYRLLSTSVYSLDWICRGFALTRGHQHLFLEHIPARVPGCKVYSSYSHDLLLRRQHQAAQVYDRDHLAAAIDYATSYLRKRLSPQSAHTYSPLITRTSELSKLSNLLKANPGSLLWVYYTNSPDELVSISHDYHCAQLDSAMPWDDSGVAQNEVAALQLMARMAQQKNALLVIRQHPRLGPEARSSFLSSEYHQIADCCAQLEQLYPRLVLSFEPWNPINSYELALLADRVISFRGTMPLEASLLGLRPLVLAVNKGYMNYAIKLHAESAPRTLEDLQDDLETEASCYSFDELATFLIQFYLVRSHGVISLADDQISRNSLSQALHNRTSMPSTPAIQSPLPSGLPGSQPQTSPHDATLPALVTGEADFVAQSPSNLETLILAYLEEAYSIAASAFGLG